jgi:hypothetical protein
MTITRTTFTRISLAVATGVLLLAGCAKDTETAPSAPSKISMLTSGGPWRITSYTRTVGSAAPTDRQDPAACARDDRYTFSSNGVQTRNEGPLACAGSTPNAVVNTAPWNFNSDQTQITIGSGSTAIAYSLVALNSDRMELRWTRTSNGQNVVDNILYMN